ncbi:MAG: cysteine desulfurase family protein [Betaproteobacteria bacterium]
MPVYFDNNATTRLSESALEAMMPFFTEEFGNASSRHDYGSRARMAINIARERVAALVSVDPVQVIFTSGGTEANNMFFGGMAAYLKPSQVVISGIEHPCVSVPASKLVRQGWSLDNLKVTKDGKIRLSEISVDRFHLNGLVSVMLANNETGVIQPVREIARVVRQAGGWIHSDAVQALGKIKVDFEELGVHALSISAHKINGPKGIGALIIDKKLPIEPFINGGGHERGYRSGTENVASIVGFGVAAEEAQRNLDRYQSQVSPIRDKIESDLALNGATIFGKSVERLPNTTCFSIPGIHGETLVMELNKSGFAVASGAACSSHNEKASATLSAMNVSESLSLGAVRVSLGPQNSHDEASRFGIAVSRITDDLKNMASVAISA